MKNGPIGKQAIDTQKHTYLQFWMKSETRKVANFETVITCYFFHNQNGLFNFDVSGLQKPTTQWAQLFWH